MSWHKQSADSFARVLRRIAARAENLSGDMRTSAEDVIHEVRLLIKRVRALLWFARPSLARTIEAEARTQLRKAAQLLAGRRDLTAAQTTFEKMLDEIDSTRERQAVEKTSQVLRARNGTADGHTRENIGKAVKLLCDELDDFAQAVERSGKWPSATKRTEKAFRVMRKTGKKARRTKDNADFHAWRKKAKRLLYLLEMQDGEATRRHKRMLERVYKLQSTLGDDHDCVVTAQQLPGPTDCGTVAREVTKLLGERQRRLRKKSVKLARRIDAVA
ncbi:MAG TPA: CHAD domain-containing protein [Candidatus Methylacidiphilales bacterium]|nr:CHAD domain-containing protein [Candidatus Methylacidiphilales bacterium]